jgi:UDP-4-amino-4,6-dideoxy-N-acetyl-beta-L-altrosamine transaminase
MANTVPYGRQNVNQADIDAVIEVLRSDYLTQGPVVPKFENAIAEYCNTKYAVAVNNATSALHIACLALGVTKGDWVWTSPITFVASANCALYCGAQVDFVDIDPHTYNISVASLDEKLHEAEIKGKLPKVVIPVHLCGQSCDMAKIHALSKRYGFKIIEDASHAIGGKFNNQPIGSCRFSDITVFSFHPVKIITTGEGGVAVTNDLALAEQMRLLRSHGITNNQLIITQRQTKEIWTYQQIELGFNYRMTDIQAALGLSQLTRLDEFVTRRHAIAKRYDTQLADLPVIRPWQSAESVSSYHLYPIRLQSNLARKTQREVFYSLRSAGILVNLHYIPVYRQPYYQHMGFPVNYCPEAERYYSETISIPIYPNLTAEQQDQVITAIHDTIES